MENRAPSIHRRTRNLQIRAGGDAFEDSPTRSTARPTTLCTNSSAALGRLIAIALASMPNGLHDPPRDRDVVEKRILTTVNPSPSPPLQLLQFPVAAVPELHKVADTIGKGLRQDGQRAWCSEPVGAMLGNVGLAQASRHPRATRGRRHRRRIVAHAGMTGVRAGPKQNPDRDRAGDYIGMLRC